MTAHDSRVFDFLKRRREPAPTEWQTSGISFLGEQSGPQRANDENRGPEGSSAPVEVVLCVAAPEDVAIVEVVGEEFQKRFHSSQHMDTLFLTDAQEREVAKVARPFYSV